VLKYLIFCLPRTGSSLLGDLLATQPASAYDDERLHPKFWRGARMPIYRLLHFYPYTYLDYRCWLAQRQGKTIYGFKLFPRHVRWTRAMLLRLSRQHWQILHVQRRDLFHQVLSLLVAFQTGRYDGDHVDAPPRLYLEPGMVAKQLWLRTQRLQEIDAFLQGIEHLDIVYEDDLIESARWDALLARIAVAWGIRFAPAQTGFRKTWQQPYSELIVNYADLLPLAETPGL
jgi:LPS sulfotransferase NodH